MIEILKPWVMNIVIVIFFLIISDILLPDGNIKQYIKVILGLFVILVIVKPLLDIKNINSNFENIYIETNAFLETDSLKKDVEALNIYHKEKAMALYENNIKNIIINAISQELSIDNNLINVQLKLEKNNNSPDFGMLKQVFITIPDSWDKTSVEKIKKVRILDGKKVIYKDEKEYNFNEKTYTEDIKNILIKLLPIKKDSIQVKFAIDNGGDSK